MTIQDYLDLITSEYSKQPKFNAMVSFMVSVQVRVQQLMAEMMTLLFDLDKPPVGDQLDIIGKWAGVSRQVNIPITGIYFTWDDTLYDGWDFGTWQPPGQDTAITELPDDAYLTLIRARIAANSWDGTTDNAYEIWDRVFPNFKILIQDNNDMSYQLAIVGGIVDALTLALLIGGYIPLRPEGVQTALYYVPVDSNPGFGWDTENGLLDGWDEGSWLNIIVP